MSGIFTKICLIIATLFCVGCGDEPPTNDAEKGETEVSAVHSQNVGSGKISFMGRIREVSALPPDMAEGEYEHALGAFLVEPLLPLPDTEKRQVVVAFAWVMRDRKMTEVTALRAGEAVIVEMLPMVEASQDVKTSQRYDTIDTLTSSIYFATDLESREPVTADSVLPSIEFESLQTWDPNDDGPRKAMLASSQEKQAAIAETRSLIASDLKKYGDGSWDLWKKRLTYFREDIQQAKNREWNTDASVIFSVSTPTLLENIEVEMQPAVAIISLANQLAQQGIDFIYVSVPTKPDIAPEKFSPRHSPELEVVGVAKAEYLDYLLENGIEVLYTDPLLLDFRKNHPDIWLVMPGKDGHLGPDGVRLIGEALAERLSTRIYMSQFIGQTDFFVENQDYSWGEEYGWKETWPVTAQRVKNAATGEFFEGNSGSPIAIVGDSHILWWQTKMGRNAGLAAHCSMRLGHEVYWEATRGTQPHVFNRYSPDWYEGRKCIVLVQTSIKIYNLSYPVRPVHLQK